MGFDAESTTDEVISGIRLDAKHAVVTGSTGGLGIETARALASIGASVTICGRNPEKIAAALTTLRQQLPEATFDSLEVDLASLANIAGATKTFVDRGQSIDLLVNNAGVMMCPEGQTGDGFETQFGTNHLGHFAWTAQLMPALANNARVVTLSSGAHLRGSVDHADLNWKSRDYDPSLAYAQSKTANIWFASELQRRHGDRLLSLSLHPGVIQTDLARHIPAAVIEVMRAGFEKEGVVLKTVPQGAATSVWAATSPELIDHGGSYLLDCQIAQPTTTEDPRTGYAAWAFDRAGAERLWTQSEELTGVRFA
jgi:NAD(P)-dependent dehydrogenase (short-subunit alcohol dehydrogenase family)